MLSDSGDAMLGLPPLGEEYAGHAILYANDLYNATPASGAQLGRTTLEGFLGRASALGVFRRFGCRVYVHTPGKPHAHRRKRAPRGVPGRFLGFEAPFGSGIYKVLLDSGQITQSQTVVFHDAPYVAPPPILPPSAPPLAANVDGDDDSDEDELEQSATTAPGAMHPLLTVQAPAAAQVPVTAQVLAAPQVPVAAQTPTAAQAPAGRPVRGTRNPA
jgi:hypothetical protein